MNNGENQTYPEVDVIHNSSIYTLKRLRCRFPWKPPNFVILPAAHKQEFPRYYRILIMRPWPRPFIWSSWNIALTPDMLILCRHVQVYSLGRLSIDGFSFERVAQFNREWIFIKLDSGFQSLVGFRILSAGFRIPKPRIPDSTSKKFLDSGIRIPLHGAIQLFLAANIIVLLRKWNHAFLLLAIALG